MIITTGLLSGLALIFLAHFLTGFTLGANIAMPLSVITLMMEVPRTSETSADNYFTRQFISEDKSELDKRRRENLKSHTYNVI
jgi:hypothetical protein